MTTDVATQNTVVVSKLYDAFKCGDIPYILDAIADNCEWNAAGAPLVPYAGKYIGKDTARFFSKMAEDFEFPTFDVNEIIELKEDEVIVFGHYVVKAHKTGKTGESDWVMHWRFEDGKVVYFNDYHNTVQMALAISN